MNIVLCRWVALKVLVQCRQIFPLAAFIDVLKAGTTMAVKCGTTVLRSAQIMHHGNLVGFGLVEVWNALHRQ